MINVFNRCKSRAGSNAVAKPIWNGDGDTDSQPFADWSRSLQLKNNNFWQKEKKKLAIRYTLCLLFIFNGLQLVRMLKLYIYHVHTPLMYADGWKHSKRAALLWHILLSRSTHSFSSTQFDVCTYNIRRSFLIICVVCVRVHACVRRQDMERRWKKKKKMMRKKRECSLVAKFNKLDVVVVRLRFAKLKIHYTPVWCTRLCATERKCEMWLRMTHLKNVLQFKASFV